MEFIMIRGTGKWSGVPENLRKPTGQPRPEDFQHLKTGFQGAATVPVSSPSKELQSVEASGATHLLCVAEIGSRAWGL